MNKNRTQNLQNNSSRKLKIFLPFALKDIGGTSIFAKKFKKEMEKVGHEVVFEPCNNYDILFIIVDCPLHHVIKAKRLNKPVVQRLDGCYYPSVNGPLYWFKNLKAKIIHAYYANHVIYQSKYSKKVCNQFLGVTKVPYSIIYNGVERKLFSPSGKRKVLTNTNKKIIITSSRFRLKSQLEPLIEATRKLWEVRQDFKLVLIGTFQGEASKYAHLKDKYIDYKGKIPNNELASYYRSSDIFILTHINPPCPNNVIEAMSCGLPICGIADGAMPELVTENAAGKLLVVRGDSYFKKRNIDISDFSSQIDDMLTHSKKYKKQMKTFKSEFLIQEMNKKYIKIFEEIL